MILDLDPPIDDFDLVRRAARIARDLLDELGLAAWPMITGSHGMHVDTPLDRDEFDDSRLGPRRYTIRNLFRRSRQKEKPWTGNRPVGLVARSG